MRLINNRYQILTILGQGGMGTTYSAVDLSSSNKVAIKVVSLRQIDNWKTLELFEREAKILKQLNHPNIPNYIDYFEIDTAEDRQFYLVRELVKGESLANCLTHKYFTETEVIKIAVAILKTLIYLHLFSPPIIHRDIKPENIIRESNGKVSLVDFGAVQNILRNTSSFVSTFVGTLGYMPPEQLTGHVVPASDIYSLGCTIIFLLAKRPPSQLPISRLKINFKEFVNVSEKFADWLEKALEPFVEDRYKDAKDALKNLQSIAQSKIINDDKLLSLQQLNDKRIRYSNFEFYDLSPTAKNNTHLLNNVKYSLLFDGKNTLLWECGDSHPFYPYKLTINRDKFRLKLDCSGRFHSVKGSIHNLSVFVVEKQFDNPSDDLFAIISDGYHHYKFATQLLYKQRVELVTRINYFIEQRKTQCF